MPTNLLTEEEARTKWCPSARVHVAHDEGSVCNRLPDGRPDPGSLCIASACMAWRWAGIILDPTDPGRGCCGLAGPA